MKKKPLKQNVFLHTPFDSNLILAIVFLNIFGLIMIYSASYYYAVTNYHKAPTHFLKGQIEYVLLGLFAMFVISYIRPSIYKKILPIIAWILMFMTLFSVRIPGIGWASHGAYRWIRIPGTGRTIQIAEPIKILAIVYLSNFISKYKIAKPKFYMTLIITFAVLGLGLLFLSNNLSTAVIVFMMMYMILIIHHPNPKGFIILLVSGILFIAAAVLIFDKFVPYNELENFRITRIRAWLHPTNELFADDTAYQATQALYAIASGGIFGKGLGQSLLKFKLPEPHNDYILSIIFEELGVFGAALLTYLFIYLLYRIYIIYKECRDKAQQILVLGVFMHLALQVLLNYAVTLGILPTTGVTLPFISAGGSSAFFTLCELGVVQAVARQNKETEMYRTAEQEMEEKDPYYREIKDEERLKKRRAAHEKYLKKRERMRKANQRKK